MAWQVCSDTLALSVRYLGLDSFRLVKKLAERRLILDRRTVNKKATSISLLLCSGCAMMAKRFSWPSSTRAAKPLRLGAVSSMILSAPSAKPRLC
jgi:hypothetical protein